MSLPLLVVTGASGFVGRHLLQAVADDYEVVGIARRSQARSHAPVHPNIRWFQADIADAEALAAVFRSLPAGVRPAAVVHLAAHYDFTGDEDPAYWRTNVHGLRNVMELVEPLRPGRFLFSSSLAACAYEDGPRVLDERSPADGVHVYSRTKAAGEAMLRDSAARLPSTIVRFAALYSDWCEYPPLFMFLQTWLSTAWNRSFLGGRGMSAVPYLHVHDAVAFLVALLRRGGGLPPAQVLLASPDRPTTHRELFETATLLHDGARRRPRFVPRPLCRPGMWGRDALGRLLGDRPFERPWMARYVDARMQVDASRSRALLGWEPRERLEVLRRMPFLIENLRSDPETWHARNRAALKAAHTAAHLVIHRLLERHQAEIAREFTEVLLGPEGRPRFRSYQGLSPHEHRWNHRLILRHLLNAIRTTDRAVFVAYCRDLAEHRRQQGFRAEEVCGALEELNRICLKTLRRDPEAAALRSEILDHVTMTLRWGCDQAQEVFEEGLPLPEDARAD